MNIIFKRSFLLSLGYLFLVTCSGGNDSPTEPEPTPPAANFTFTPSSGYAPLTVQFTSTSSGDITTYAWDFQNNLTTESAQRNPEYTYTEPGVYSVRLAVQGPGGNDTKIQENSITVLEVNAPVIEDIAQQTNEDVPLQITLSGTDPQDLELTYLLSEGPQNGAAEINGSTLVYTPNENWNGTETLKYIANNQYLDSNEATITITVNAVDDEPNTLDVSVETDEDTAISFTLSANEVDGDSYTFGILSNPSNGTIALNGNNVLYTPDANWNGVDTFTFEATDERMAFENKFIINVGTATITVNAVNDAPVADNLSVNLVENTALLISFSASDVESDNLSYSITSQPSNGGLGAVSGSQVLYTPNSDFNGTDSFTYQANDGTDNSNVASVTITITPANTAPVATNQSLTTDEDTSASLNLDATDINGDNLTYVIVENPSNATVSIDGSSATFTPNSNWNGTESFTWKANDGLLDSNTATVSVIVNAINDAPVANNISTSYDTRTDASVNITLSASDPEDDTLSYSIVSDVSNGSTSISGSIVTYTASTDFEGTDTFTYKVNDGEYDSNTATVTITVDGEDVPTTTDVSASTNEDTAVTITLDGADEDGDTLAYSIVSDVSNGSTSLSGSTVTYTPDTNWNGTDIFTYKANDGTADSNTSTVTINVTAVNDAPKTDDETASTDEDTAVNISVTASDVEADDVTFSIVSDASNGTTSVSDSTITYTPDANYNGTDTFTYKANDGKDDSNTSTVTITVASVNDAPVANDVSGSTNENRSMQLNITLDATDIDGDALTYSIVSDVSNGSTSISGSTLTYTPDTNWNGTDTFTYKANDGLADSNTATGTITVSEVNDAPNADNVSASTDEDVAVDITLSASDVEGDDLTYSIVSNVSNGSTSLSESTVTYTPDANYNGTDTFTYKANDGTSDSNTSTVTITIAAVNDAPTTEDFALTGNEDTMLEGSFDGSDIDGDNLTYSVVDQPSNGTVIIDGSVVQFDPNNDWNGTDTFTYKANDGTVDSNTSTITITVTATNDAPTTADVSASTNEDTQVDITLDGSDIDGDNLTYSIVATNNGSVTISGSTATYTPDSNYNGTDTFTYKANDGTADSNTSTVTITVAAVNDAPVAENVTGSTNENRMSQLGITLVATDVDGDDLTYSIVSTNDGTVTVSGSTATYTPDDDWNGTDTFTYKANDGTVDSNTATATITVAATNDAPTTADVSASTNEDTQVDITLDGSDIDGDNLTYSIVATNNGSVTISGSTATYTPDSNYNGTDTFTYKANDGTADSNTSTVTITVASVNDAPVTTNASGTIVEDTTQNIDLSSEASDLENDSLTYSIVSDVLNGSTSINGSLVTYTPNLNFNGTDTFTWKVNDGTNDSNISTRTINISAVNDLPTTSAQTASTDEDTAVDITLESTDPDTGDTITYSIVSDVSNGSTSLSGSTVTYTPDTNWNGTDTFTFKANDGTGDSNTSTVTITVAAVNDGPTSADEGIIVDEDASVRTGFSSSDVEGDTITLYEIVSQPSNGTASIDMSNNEPGLYVPNENYNGTDSFTYRASDGSDWGNTATATVTISAVNDVPVTSDQTASTNEDANVDITLESTDVDTGDTITYSIVSDVSNGSTSLSGSTVTYTPTADYNGTDTFTFKANDGTADSNTSTVTITVTSVEDSPITADVSASTDEDTAVDITLDGSDADSGDTLTYSVVATNNGSVTISGSTATYTPDSNYNGTDTFTYKVNDGDEDSNTSTVTITVAAVNDLPTTSDISTTIDENRYARRMTGITLQGSDVDGDDLTYSVVSDASNGSTSISGATLTYTATQDWNGTETITYKANDGTGDSNTSTITITVTPVNDAPVVITPGNDSSTDLSMDYTSDSSDYVKFEIDYSDWGDNNTSNSDPTVVNNPASTYGIASHTISMWAYFESFSGYLLSEFSAQNSDGVHNNYQIKVNSSSSITVEHNHNYFNPWTNGPAGAGEENIDVSTNMQTGVWYHFVWVNEHGIDGSTQGSNNQQGNSETQGRRFYINGTFVASHYNAGSQILVDQGILIGNYKGTSSAINGYIDGFALFNDAITAAEITELYNQGRNYDLRQNTGNYTSKSNLKAFFDFSTTNANGTLDDLTGNSNQDATISGASVVAGSDSYTLVEDSSITVSVGGTDVENDPLTYSIDTDPTNGTASVSGHKITYTPDTNFAGTDSLKWVANDGALNSAAGTITFTVTNVQDAPLTSNVSGSTDEDTAVNITLSGSDVDTDDTLTYSLVTTPSFGSASISGSTLTYTPTSNYYGIDSFTYKVNDGTEDSNTSSIEVTVSGASNDRSAYFSGGPTNSPYIYYQNNHGLGDPGEALSVSLWFKVAGHYDRQGLHSLTKSGTYNIVVSRLSFNNGTGNGGNSYADNTEAEVDTYNRSTDGSYYDGSTTFNPSLNTWHHLAYVMDPDQQVIKVYANGQVVFEKDYDNSKDFNDSSYFSLGLPIGYDDYHGLNETYMDEYAVWDVALTSSQISTLYNSGNGGVYPTSIESSNLKNYVNFEAPTNYNSNLKNGMTQNGNNNVTFSSDTPWN